MLTHFTTRAVSSLIGEGRLCYKDPLRTSQWIVPNTVTDNIIEREDGTSIIDSTGSVASTATTLASLSDTVIAGLAGGDLLVYDGVNSWDNQPITGDITISAAGVTAFNGAIIVDADVAGAAAIAYSKLAALTDANILVGSAANVATVVAITGDVALTNGGVTTVTDLTIAAEAQGDILYRNAANWVRLGAGAAGLALITNGAGANPTWGTPAMGTASIIANNATLNDGGAFDAVLIFTTQTVGSPNLTVPDFANVDDTFCFITLAQTLLNKTLTAPAITGGSAIELTGFSIRSTGAAFDMLQATATVFTADRTLNWAIGDANRTITLAGDVTTAADFITVGANSLTLTVTGITDVTLPTTGTLATLAGVEVLTNKSLTAPAITGGTAIELTGFSIRSTGAGFDMLQATATVFTADRTLNWAIGDADRTVTLAGNVTTAADFITSGANSLTLTTTGATDVTLPTTGTLATLAGVEIFTNKSYNADGAGNVLTNVNADELDPVTPAAAAIYGIPFVLAYVLTNQAAAVNIYNVNAPFAFRVIRAWSVATSADGGTWKLNNGAGGGGTDITNDVTVAANDDDIDEPTDYNDAAWNIALNGSLSIVPSGAGLLDCVIYIECIRVN